MKQSSNKTKTPPTQSVRPVPEYPGGHEVQLKLPRVFTQRVNTSQPPLFDEHSFTSVPNSKKDHGSNKARSIGSPVQVVSPVPSKPAGQSVHNRPPAVFEQEVRGSQPPLWSRHSLTSVEGQTGVVKTREIRRAGSRVPVHPVCPVPRKPLGQVPQTREPSVLVHEVSRSQPPLELSHSSMSACRTECSSERHTRTT
jgi:hypothetical protein